MKDRRKLYRILDANLNRAREGLRVSEEIVRFAMDSAPLQKGFKKCRHALKSALERLGASELVKSRDSGGDVGKGPSKLEDPRKDLEGVFMANVQRVKESLRALEEFSKLVDAKASAAFKETRFRVYQLEKRALPKLEALRDHVSGVLGRTRRGVGYRRSNSRRRKRRSTSR